MSAPRPRPSGWRFPALLALLLGVLLVLLSPVFNGDVVEYTLDTVAVADHGSPAIRLDDLARVRALLPGQFVEPFDLLERDLRAQAPNVYPAFARGRDGAVYPVHFFGYPLLAAAPFKLFEALGAPPFKAFVALNLAAVFALGLALRRYFGCARRAWAGLALFMLCGGALYLRWTSPECLSAAALLAGLLYFTSGAPLAGALLAGLASLQNPTIAAFFGFAPLFLLLQDEGPGRGLAARLHRLREPSLLGALAAGAAVFSLPLLFNLWQYGVPSLIAQRFSDPSLVGTTRLVSFYLDPNQGMLVGVPGLMLVIAWLAARKPGLGAQLALSLLFTLVLALPTLAVLNWNSAAAGPMRYAFWAAMPLLYVLLAWLRSQPRWPRILLPALFLLQAGAMAHAASYEYVAFSPAARLLLRHAPQLYHPEPEIFAERSGGNDDYISTGQVYLLRHDGSTRKVLLHRDNTQAAGLLCGQGATLAPDQPWVASTRGWRYLDGSPRCLAAGLPQRSLQLPEFRDGRVLAAGWHTPEGAGTRHAGVWSDGARSRLQVAPEAETRIAQLVLVGHYLAPNSATRVVVNGIDLGWQALDRAPVLALPPAARGATLDIELFHQFPHAPGAHDRRALALFLREVDLRWLPTRH